MRLLNWVLACAVMALVTTSPLLAGEKTARSMLGAFAEDYALDPTAKNIDIGFKIDEESFFLRVVRRETQPHSVDFSVGFPDYPIVYWEMSLETLRLLDQGMTGETATSRARADDPRLMTLRSVEGFPRYLLRRNSEFTTFLNSFKVHFFAKGMPEIVPISSEFAVSSHGAGVVGLAYAPRVSIFVTLTDPGQEVNTEEGMDINPFDTVYVALSGRIRARVDGNDAILEAGHAMYIPADVSHQFWNDFDEPFSGVMVLYGPWLNESPPERAYPW